MKRSAVLTAASAAVLIIVSGCAQGAGDGASAPPPSPDDPGTAVPTALIIDASGSMARTDAPGPRIAAAKHAAGTLIDIVPAGTDFAVVAYGTRTGNDPEDKAAGCRDVTTLIPRSTIDSSAAKAAVEAIAPSGYTPIAAALGQAADELPDSGGQAIVLVSDGEDTCDTPPCDVAAQLHQQRPELTISTVGFRTEGEGDSDLACIANTTGGLFVTADNADQLAARLLATQNLDTAKTALTSTGLGDVQIGQSADDIRAAHSDLPPVSSEGTVTVVWRNCDLTFDDGILTSIAPHDDGHTIDGIHAGSTVGEVTAIYGDPVNIEPNPDGTYTLVFPADPAAGTGFQITADGTNSDAVVTTIVLCKCLPTQDPADAEETGNEPLAAPKSADSDSTALTFGGTPQIQAGMNEAGLAALGITPTPTKEHGCNTYTIPGAPYLKAVAAKGTVLGVKASYDSDLKSVDPATHTADGIEIGSTAAQVREVYADQSMTESFQGLNSENLILVTNDEGQSLGISFDGNSDASAHAPDTATVKGISGGTRDLASGFEVCSG